MSESENKPITRKITLTLSWKLLAIVLAVLLAAVVVYTRPWESQNSDSRTITIKGETSIKRAPDSFVFNPSFEADSQTAINQKTKEVVEAVKALGLGDAGIQTQISNYEDYKDSGPTGTYTYSVYLTLSVEDKDLAQKIQDYLAGSGAVGSISPSTGFTKATQKALKDEATLLAAEDAKARAEKTANNLGVKLGQVIKVNEPEEYGDFYPTIASYDSSIASEGESLPINSGESEFNYSVTVEFAIR